MDAAEMSAGKAPVHTCYTWLGFGHDLRQAVVPGRPHAALAWTHLARGPIRVSHNFSLVHSHAAAEMPPKPQTLRPVVVSKQTHSLPQSSNPKTMLSARQYMWSTMRTPWLSA
jgi:hypothetical protein